MKAITPFSNSILAVTLGLVLFSSATTLAQSMSAGQWSAQASFKLNGIPLPPSHSTECLSATEAKDARTTIEKSLKQKSCKLTSWLVQKKILKASVECKNAEYDFKGDLAGLFDKRSYDLSGEVKGSHKLIGNARANVEFSGKWISACPK